LLLTQEVWLRDAVLHC